MDINFEATAGADAQSAVDSLRFSAAGADDPFDAWRSLLLVLFDSVAPKRFPRVTCEANLVVRHFGTFLLGRSFADGGRYRRNDTRLAWDDLDHLVISCLMSGGIAVGGPARRLRPGDVAVLDLSSPVHFSMMAAEAVHLIVPRIALPASVAPTASSQCRVYPGSSAMAILLRGMIDSLFQASRYFSPVEVVAVGAFLPELLGWCLGAAPAVSPSVAKADLGKRLRRYIEDNLGRSDLTTSRLAREMGVSRSQLYRQFETIGGVETYIRGRRLRRSLQALCDPSLADLRIGEIAYDIGFADVAHFSRLFRQTYGQSPRDMRSAAREGGNQRSRGAAAAAAHGSSLADWLLTLGSS